MLTLTVGGHLLGKRGNGEKGSGVMTLFLNSVEGFIKINLLKVMSKVLLILKNILKCRYENSREVFGLIIFKVEVSAQENLEVDFFHKINQIYVIKIKESRSKFVQGMSFA
jgi:hypothetical protein